MAGGLFRLKTCIRFVATAATVVCAKADQAALLQGNVLGLIAGTALIKSNAAALPRDTVPGGWLLAWLAPQLGNARPATPGLAGA